MKPILILFFALSLTAGTIEKHSGVVFDGVEIIEVDEHTVRFRHKGEKAITFLSLLAVKKITFESGRVESFPLERGVILIDSPKRSKGLIFLGDEKGYSSWSGVNSNQGKDSAVRDLIRDAPRIGGNVILVESTAAYFTGSRAKGEIYATTLGSLACKTILERELISDFEIKELVKGSNGSPLSIVVSVKQKNDKYESAKYLRATFWAEHEGKEFKLEASKDGQEFWEISVDSTIVTDGAPGVGESVLDVTIDNDIKLYRCPLKEVSAWADAYVILYKPGDRKLDEWIMKVKQKRKPTWTIPVGREKIKKFPIPA